MSAVIRLSADPRSCATVSSQNSAHKGLGGLCPNSPGTATKAKPRETQGACMPLCPTRFKHSTKGPPPVPSVSLFYLSIYLSLPPAWTQDKMRPSTTLTWRRFRSTWRPGYKYPDRRSPQPAFLESIPPLLPSIKILTP